MNIICLQEHEEYPNQLPKDKYGAYIGCRCNDCSALRHKKFKFQIVSVVDETDIICDSTSDKFRGEYPEDERHLVGVFNEEEWASEAGEYWMEHHMYPGTYRGQYYVKTLHL